MLADKRADPSVSLSTIQFIRYCEIAHGQTRQPRRSPPNPYPPQPEMRQVIPKKKISVQT